MRQAASPAGEDNGRIAWIAGWALAAAILVVGSGLAALNQDFAEPDNAMRLVRIRDMLAGQGWFDNVQHRLNPPDGTPMHWAQWIDAVLAAPIALLSPVIGQHNAEIAMAFAWPLGLLAVFMMLVVRVSSEIGARDCLRREAQWTGAIVAALAFPAIDKFAPGSFDHHNVELILMMGAMLGLMRMREYPRAAAWAGGALGAAVATAAEAAPMVAAALLVSGVLWLFRPKDFSRGLAWLGVGLAASSLVMFAALVAPKDWLRPVCDAMGAPFLGFGFAGGVVAITLGRLPEAFVSNLPRRLASAAVLGVVATGMLVVLFPECAGGGYSAMSADMEQLWMSQISETRSLVMLASDGPGMILSVAGAAFAGLVAAVFYLKRHWRDEAGWIALTFLLAAWVVLAWQIRGTTFATAAAIPFGAWAVALARRYYRSKATAIRALAFAGIAASSTAAAWASAGEALQSRLISQRALASYETRTSNSKECLKPAAFKALADIPIGVMLNQFVLGANVLVWSKSSILAGPYHRNGTGTMTMINALRSAPDAARAIVLNSPADYVLVCPASPETGFYARHPANGVAPEETLSALLGEGRQPDWLQPVELANSPLKLYRVVR